MKNCGFNIFSILCLSLIAVACGGGGSDSPPSHTVSTSVSGGGTISPVSRRVAHNSSTSFTLAADAGFVVDQVTGCQGELTGATYITGAITGDCTVSATFAQATFIIAGEVAGLVGTLELLLELSDSSELLRISRNGPFSFETRLPPGEPFEVTVVATPEDQTCRVENGFGEASADMQDVAVVCVSGTTTATLSGVIEPAAATDLDSDVNDLRAPFASNSTVTQAQRIHNRTTLQGFASAAGTGGNQQFERYAVESDRDDYFSVSLQAGQVVRLQVVDFEGFTIVGGGGDLDLNLLNANHNLVDASDSIGEFEEVTAPDSGDYFINVHAFSGSSKYVLHIFPAGAGDLSAEAANPLADFIPGEMIIKRDNQSTSVNTAGVFSKMSFTHSQGERAALAKLGADVRLTGAASMPDHAMQALEQLNPDAYAKIRTLRDIKTVREQPGVIYAEPNYIRSVSRGPDDPGYIYQWHYTAINLPQAWDITTGAAEQDVIVAVIDTGVFLSHRDLAGNMVDGYDFISSPERARDGDGIDPDPDDPGDSPNRGGSTWHGTHVAGTIAATSDNARGVAGASWNAKIMPIRVMGSGGGTSYDVMQGLRYAAGLSNDSGERPARRADVANLSLGGLRGSIVEQDAYGEAQATGMIIVAAAGNENTSAPTYPAAYDSVISVSATDSRNRRAPYSNFGDTITVAAPGGDLSVDLNGSGYPDGILSTLADDTSGVRESNYAFYQGTSMAAPHVAGVVALMKAMYPGLTPAMLNRLLENGTITDDLGREGRDDIYGNGLINALKAVQAAQGLANGDEPPPEPAQLVSTPSAVDLGSTSSATITLTNRGGGDPVITQIDVDVDWLSVTAAAIDDNGLGTYDLRADRSIMEEGLHQAIVTFTADDGSEVRVQVYAQVGEISVEGDLPPIYVLLLNADTNAVVDVVISEEVDGDRHYAFNEVPVGDYFIVGGSDIDVDDFTCQSGEACGAYPTLDSRRVIEVDGFDIGDLNFVANILGAFSAPDAQFLTQQESGLFTGKIRPKRLPDESHLR